MRHLLDFVLALGPIFGISTLLGDARAKIFGEWLLRRARDIGSAAALVALAALGFLVFIVAFYAATLVHGILTQTLADMGETSGCIGLLLVPLVVVLAILGSWLLMKSAARLLGTLATKLYRKWKAAFPLSSVPWPLNWFELDVRPRDCFLLMTFWPLLLVACFGGALALSALALLLGPLRAAEWVRQKLTPEKPHYLSI